MRTKQRAAVVLIKNNQLLVIKRQKGDRPIYYVLPGGGVESGESPEKAAQREAKEELGIDIELEKKIADLKNRGQLEHYYLAKDYQGKITFTGDNEANPNIFDQQEWVSCDELEKINLLPEKLKLILIDFLRS